MRTSTVMGKSQVSFEIQIVHTTDTWCIGGNSTWGPHCNMQALWWEKVHWVFDSYFLHKTDTWCKGGNGTECSHCNAGCALDRPLLTFSFSSSPEYRGRDVESIWKTAHWSTDEPAVVQNLVGQPLVAFSGLWGNPPGGRKLTHRRQDCWAARRTSQVISFGHLLCIHQCWCKLSGETFWVCVSVCVWCDENNVSICRPS